MKRNLLAFLACPYCGKDITLTSSREEKNEVVEGTLSCTACGRKWPIINGIPRMVNSLDMIEQRSAEGFGYEWTKMDIGDIHSTTDLLLDMIFPIEPEHFRGKCVLDAGCGRGQTTIAAADFGAATVIGVDFSRSVEVAYKFAVHRPEVHIIQADILALPLKLRIFDYAFSVGVLHHTSKPETAFHSILKHIKEGGSISIWVYGKHPIHTYFVEPIRRIIIQKIPIRMVEILAYFFTTLLCTLTKMYAFLGTILGKMAPYVLPAYKRVLYYQRWTFRQMKCTIFDMFQAPIVYRYSKGEIIHWFKKAGIKQIQVSDRRGSGWRGFSVLPIKK